MPPSVSKDKPKDKAAQAGGSRGAEKEGKSRHEHSAGFVLFRQTHAGPVYLLLDYGKHWDYPKGHLEAGESPWRAAVRELLEETGIRQVDRVPGFQQDMRYYFFSAKKGRVAKTVTFFLGRTRTEAVALSDEHTGYAWLAYEDAMERLTYANARNLLAAAHHALLNPPCGTN